MSTKIAVADKAAVAVQAAQAHTVNLTENVIYLMGLSFVLGCFFTILVLILLDFMRRDQHQPGVR